MSGCYCTQSHSANGAIQDAANSSYTNNNLASYSKGKACGACSHMGMSLRISPRQEGKCDAEVVAGERLNVWGDIDAIFSLIYAIVGVWCVLTYGAILYALIRYRRSRHPQARYSEGNRPAQYGWILALALVVLALDIGIDLRGEEVWEKIKGRVPPSDVRVRVTRTSSIQSKARERVNPSPWGRGREPPSVFLPSLLASPLSQQETTTSPLLIHDDNRGTRCVSRH